MICGEYWIAQAPEDGAYDIYCGDYVVDVGFESLEEAWKYLDEMEQ